MSSVENILGSVREALVATSRSLLVDDAAFGRSLRIGQIVKGRVMRHYEGGRYLMDFGGQQKVVDSSLPLRISEVVTARVVAVGDQVHLERLRSHADAASELAASVRATRPDASPQELALHALFEQYNATPELRELGALARSVGRAANPGLMSLSALLLHKIGVAAAPALLQAMYRRLDTATPPEPPRPTAMARLVADREATPAPADRALEPLAARLRALAGASDAGESREPERADPPETPDPGAGSLADDARGDGRRDPERQWLLGQWLLNAQSHPRISQRLVRMPLWLGDRVVEVSVALFSEGERTPGEPSADGIPFRRAVLFLELGRLGKVQVTLNAAQSSLRVAVAAGGEAAVARLACHVAPLRETLGALGWRVAEVQYLQMELSPSGEVVDTIVHHHLTQDSLSRWM